MSNVKVGDLIGVPFIDRGRDPATGLDCWGLFSIVMARFGIDVPPYEIACMDTAAISDQAQREIELHWKPIARPYPGCAVAMKTAKMMPRAISHIGVYLGRGWMIHTLKGVGSIKSKIRAPEWKHRIKGFYEYVGDKNAG